MRSRTILAGGLASLMAIGAPATAQADQQRTVTATGAASIVVPNDVARFTFGVSAQRRTAAAALQLAAARERRVARTVQALGVAAADVSTGTLSVGRVTRRAGARTVVEYRASQSILVAVRQVRQAGTVVSAAVRAGASEVEGPEFEVGDPAAAYRRALRAAFAQAREKAQMLADEAGARLGGVVSITEGSAQTQPQGFARTPARPNAPRPAPVVRPGTTTVDAQVTVSFALE
jgi:uncharacterized protein YggE